MNTDKLADKETYRDTSRHSNHSECQRKPARILLRRTVVSLRDPPTLSDTTLALNVATA